MNQRTRGLVLLFSAPILAYVVLGGYLGRTFAQEDSYRPLQIFEDVVSLILTSYVEEVEVDRIMAGALRGLSRGLDADSAYLTRSEVTVFETNDPVPKGRTGITLTRQYYLRVLSARDGSAAATAGLRPGDYIRSINGESTRDMSILEGARLLRGAVDSTVTLTVIRSNATEPQEIVLKRTQLTTSTVTSRLVASGIGFLRVAAFHEGVADDITSEVNSLRAAGAGQLVIDLRGTADGNYANGVEAARLFVGSGTLAVRQRRGEPQHTTVAEAGDGSITLPTVILIGAATSGAAELFASALAANARAELVGEPTFGRVAEQRLIKLPDGSGLWLYWAQYLTATGERLHQQGLEPGIAIATPVVELGAEPPESDPVLEKAIERLAAA
ncbi:MAG: hypothetical protein CL489_15340 [Acidobacteria bacterium]|nr:hypothetical protein [Acidobacteriota bacterium]MBF85829.1 hypothetical protein [Acidobacteriota bacterium]MEC7768475.1 S41 family peptidase [Acidobacteriota bacterium]